MDILFYEYLKKGLQDHNTNQGKPHGNKVVGKRTSDTTYPHTVFQEIRNTANASYNTCFDRVASVGYKVEVYAKDKGKVENQTIAREIAQMIDAYLTAVGLTRVSYNAFDMENENSTYAVIMTYTGNLHENRAKLL